MRIGLSGYFSCADAGTAMHASASSAADEPAARRRRREETFGSVMAISFRVDALGKQRRYGFGATRGSRGRRRRMRTLPVAGDVEPPAEPHLIERSRVVEELRKRACTRRAAGQARVQADRHDPRHVRTLRMELVERRL